MKDVNKEIRKQYVAALETPLAALSCPIYNKQLPHNSTASLYVVIQVQQNFGDNSITCKGVEHAITLQVVSKQQNNNSGLSVDDVASVILETIHPQTFNTLVSSDSDLQIVSTNLEQDITLEGLNDGVSQIVQRNLTFTHKIKIN